MSAVFRGITLYNALKAEGFNLPDECIDVRLEMPVDGIMTLHYAISIYGEDLAKLGRALTRIGNGDEDGVDETPSCGKI